MSSPKRLDAIVTQNPILRQLIRQADINRQVVKYVQSALPGPVGDRVYGATFRDGALRIIVESAAWATKLRYLVPVLREKLSEIDEFAALKSIEVKVNVPTTESDPAISSKKHTLQGEAAEKTARELSALRDPDIRDALSRLTNKRR